MSGTKATELTPAMLRTLLRYNPETGRLFWRARPSSMFVTRRAGSTWNTRWAGKEALTTVAANGYLCGTIFAKTYLAHRVAWAMTSDAWPAEVDHKNGDRTDNRIENLRRVSRAENTRNVAIRSDNTSGVVGVCWHGPARKWRVRISTADREVHLGLFADFGEAVAARLAAEAEHGYHINHGRSV